MKAFDVVKHKSDGSPEEVFRSTYSSINPASVIDEPKGHTYFNNNAYLLLVKCYLYIYSHSPSYALRLPFKRVSNIEFRKKGTKVNGKRISDNALVITCNTDCKYNDLANDDASNSLTIVFAQPKRGEKPPKTPAEDFQDLENKLMTAYQSSSHEIIRDVESSGILGPIREKYSQILREIDIPSNFRLTINTLRNSDACSRIIKLASYWVEQNTVKKESYRYLHTKKYEDGIKSAKTMLQDAGNTLAMTAKDTVSLAPPNFSPTAIARASCDDANRSGEKKGISVLKLYNDEKLCQSYAQIVIFNRTQPFDLIVELSDVLHAFLSIKSPSTAPSTTPSSPISNKDAFVSEFMTAIDAYINLSPLYIQQRILQCVFLPVDEAFAVVNRFRPSSPVSVSELNAVLGYIEEQRRVRGHDAFPYVPWTLNGHRYLVTKEVRSYKLFYLYIVLVLYNEYNRVRDSRLIRHPCVSVHRIIEMIHVNVTTATDILNAMQQVGCLVSEVNGGVKYYYLNRITFNYRVMLKEAIDCKIIKEVTVY